MIDTQVKLSTGLRVRRLAARCLVLLLLALAIGASLKHLSASLARAGRPAGFSRGLLQGALMPMSMPNLLAGQDLTIYAQNNTGLSYKLGYTVGVNGCGAIFFGVLFWRVRKWKRTAG
jgi:hypothetical protein